MHVLVVTHRFFPKYRAGTEVLSMQLANGLKSRGYRVTVLTGEPEAGLPCSERPWISEDTYEGLATHRLHYGTADQSWSRHGTTQKLLGAARMLAGRFDPIELHMNAPERIAVAMALVKRIRPDLVHINHIIGYSAAIIPELRRLGIPAVFTPTDYFVVCPTDKLIRQFDHRLCDGPGDAINCVRCIQTMPHWAAQFAMSVGRHAPAHRPGAVFRSLSQRVAGIVEAVNAADKILPSTYFLADVLVRHGVNQTLIRVIPYGIDIGDLPPPRPVPSRFNRESPLRIGFIGQLVETKGVHILLEALSHLGERNDKVLLSIYGKIDTLDRYCQSLMKSAQILGPSVRLAGTFLPEKIGEVLRALDVLVVPSLWYESIPLVLRSALNANTPVLVSRMGGLTEPLKDNGRTQSFPAGDARALSELILRILDDPQILGRLRDESACERRTLADYLDDVEVEYRAVV